MQKKILPSGLVVVCEEIPYVRSVSMGILIKVGSRFENDEEKGMSHFVEHMFFKGTNKLSSFEIAERFDLLGTHVDAFTSREYTCFYVKMIDEYLPDVLELLSDMILNSVFQPDAIAKEQEVILEEIKMYIDSPDEYVMDLFMGGLFKNHPLGNSILGSEASVKQINREKIFTFLKKYFSPNNSIVSIAGNIKNEEAVRYVEKYFGSWEKRELNVKLNPPTCDFSMEKHDKKLEQVHICLGTEGIPYKDDDRYKLALLNDILGASASSHLYQEVREKRGLAYAITSFYENYFDTGIFTVYAAVEKERAAEFTDVVRNEFKKIINEGVSDKELHKVKAQLKALLTLSLENTANIMSRLLKQEFYLAGNLTIDEIIIEIGKVTKEDISVLTRKLLDENKLKTVMLGPN